MDQSRGFLSSLIMGVRRAVTEGVTAMRIDSLLYKIVKNVCYATCTV